MNYKRVTLLCGHYGSGKTNIAVNMAIDLKKKTEKVLIADLDIVNPYFRTKDSIEEFDKAGIKLIGSAFANTNLDAPALPQEMYAIIHDPSYHAIVDVGGDDVGAVALGRLSETIAKENDYDMFLVVNCYRPLTKDVKSTIEVKEEIEIASRLKFTGIINGSNLASGTTAEAILDSVDYAKEVAENVKLPLVATAVEESLFDELNGRIDNIFPLKLQKRPI